MRAIKKKRQSKSSLGTNSAVTSYDTSNDAEKVRLTPYQSLLRDSLLTALGASSLVGCWQVEPPPCSNPSVLQNDQGRANGYSRCSEGQMIKTGPAQCNPLREPAEDEPLIYDSSRDRYSNVTKCVTDDDCDNGQDCFCDSYGVGVCSSSYCQNCDGRCEVKEVSESSSDCGDWGDFSSPDYAMICLTNDQNECYSDEDCGYGASCITMTTEQGVPYYGCAIDELEQLNLGVTCGRPLCDGDTQVEAQLCSGHDWLNITSEELQNIAYHIEEVIAEHTKDLPLARAKAEAGLIKATLIDHWSAIAQLEHSSIASFSRLTLELMSLGAPVDLLLETQQATADEVRHAQSALEIVSALYKQPMAFAQFPTEGISIRSQRDMIIRSCVQEACLGETLGVLEAEGELELMKQAQGPEVLIKRLDDVLSDESKHAALAWRTLKWLIDGDAPDQYEKARRLDLVSDALYQTAQLLLLPKHTVKSHTKSNGDALNLDQSVFALGLLTDDTRLYLRIQGYQQVVLPALESVLGSSRTQKLKALSEYALRSLDPTQLNLNSLSA